MRSKTSRVVKAGQCLGSFGTAAGGAKQPLCQRLASFHLGKALRIFPMNPNVSPFLGDGGWTFAEMGNPPTCLSYRFGFAFQTGW